MEESVVVASSSGHDPETGERRRSAVDGRNGYRAKRTAWRFSRVVSSGTESASVGKGGNEETRTVVDVAIWRTAGTKDGEANGTSGV